jgi:hypothetical protein
MSDQRLIVPSDTPSAWAACDVDKPSGLPLIFLITLFQRVLDGMEVWSSNCTGFGKEARALQTSAIEFLPPRPQELPPRRMLVIPAGGENHKSGAASDLNGAG